MKTAKRLKRFLFIIGGVFILILGLLVAIPFLFKDELVQALKDTINKSLTAKVDFGDASLSLLQSFPNLTLTIKDLSVIGENEFEGLPLYKADKTSLTVDLKSAWNAGKKPVNIKKIVLEKPEINILVLPQGQANYDISKDTGGDSKETQYNLSLKSYELHDAKIIYDDRSLNFYLELNGLEHSGKGHLTEAVYDLTTHSFAQALTLKYGGLTYFSKAKTKLDAIFNIDNKHSKYTLKDNDLKINDLKVLVDGFVNFPEKDVTHLDLSFKAPSNNFKDLLSVVPSAYVKEFDQVKASGSFVLNGTLKGNVGPGEYDFPAINFDLEVKNGNVHYPGLPLGIAGINISSKIQKPQGDMDLLAIHMPRFHFKIGEDPLAGKLILTHPMTDPDIDVQVKGLLNLTKLSKAWPMEDVQNLAGIIDADVLLKATLSQLESGNYENVNMKGRLAIKDLVYAAAEMPPIKVQNANMKFSPRYVDVPEFDMRLGKSDLKGSARIDNILAYISPKKTMKGKVKLSSHLFDLNEWMPKEEKSATASVETTSEKPFDRFDFEMDATADKLIYDQYTLTRTSVRGGATSHALKIKSFSTRIDKSDLAGNGELTNLFGYLFEEGTLHGSLNLHSDFFDVNQFMEQPAKGGKGDLETSSVFLVPDKMDIQVNGTFKSVLYDKYHLRNAEGGIKMEDNQLKFNDVTANFLDGKMALDGVYDTRDKAEPKFDLNYALQGMKFKKLYSEMITFRKLAPVAKFIDGVFNTKLRFKGELGEDMMPDLSTLTAAGLLETVHGRVAGLEPLEKLAATLNVDEIKKLSLKDTKNWFEVKEGKLFLKPFELKHQGIDMNVSGYSLLEGDMNIDMLMKIPRQLIESTKAGAAAGAGMDWLRGQASKLGVNIKKSRFVNVKAILTGKLTAPKVKVKLLGASGESLEETAKSQAQDVLKKAEDSVRIAAQKELEKQKAKVKEEANKALDSAKAVVNTKVKEAKDEIKKKAGKAVGDATQKALDSLGVGDKADDVINKGKDILDKWNPFKKKKKKKN